MSHNCIHHTEFNGACLIIPVKVTRWIFKILSNRFPATDVHTCVFRVGFPGHHLLMVGTTDGSPLHERSPLSHQPTQVQTLLLCPKAMFCCSQVAYNVLAGMTNSWSFEGGSENSLARIISNFQLYDLKAVYHVTCGKFSYKSFTLFILSLRLFELLWCLFSVFPEQIQCEPGAC